LKPPKVYFLPIASPLHINRVYPLIEKARNSLQQLNVKVSGPLKPIERMNAIRIPINYDVLLVFVASGGSSSLLSEIVRNKRAIIWVHPEMNSLPSALNARTKLKAARAWKSEIVLGNVEKTPMEIKNEIETANIVNFLKNARVGVVCSLRHWRVIKRIGNIIRRTFHTVFKPIRPKIVKESYDKVDEKDVKRIFYEKIKTLKISNVNIEGVEKCIRLYITLKNIIAEFNLNAITIDCFSVLDFFNVTPCIPFSLLCDEGTVGVCEADLESTILMIMLSMLSKMPSWIANIVDIKENERNLLLAHCTAATELALDKKGIEITSHFESGMPAALNVPIKSGEATVVHLRMEPPLMLASKCHVISSGFRKPNLCRSQALIKINGNFETFISKVGGHVVLAYGDWIDHLRRVAVRVNIPFIKA